MLETASTPNPDIRGKEIIMNILKSILVVACLFAFVQTAYCAEPSLDQQVAAAKEQAGKAVISAAQAKEKAINAAARRASLSFGQARYEDGVAVLGAVKSGVCYIGSGVVGADGYIGAAVAIPANYVTGRAFSASSYMYDEAAR
jgi:hypothetical protein